MDSLNPFDSLESASATPAGDATGDATGDAALAQPVRKPLTPWGHISLSALWLGINAISAALAPVVLPVQILLFIEPGSAGSAAQAEFLAWLSALGAAIALLAPPLVGALSDRTVSSLGKRRPYIILGVAVTLAGAWALARPPDLVVLIAAFVVLNLGFNIAQGAYQGLLPDVTPESQRGAASGYLGLMTILGNVGSLALAGLLLGGVNLGNIVSPSVRSTILSGSSEFYGFSALALLVTTFITLIWTHEPAPGAPPVHPVPPQTGLLARGMASVRALWLEPWKSHNFTWVFLTRAFVMMGLTLFLTFIEYYFANVVGVSDFVSQTALVAGMALVGAMLSALALGILSDHMNRTLLVGVSSALMAAPALAFVVAAGRIPLWPLGLVFGLGYGAYTSVDWALAVDALPTQSDAGKDMGIWSAASTLPSVLAPVLGGAVIALVIGLGGATALGYQSIFALAAFFLALGAVCVSFIRGEPGGGAAPATQPDEAPAARHPERRPGAGWRLAGDTRGGHARGFLRFWPVWEWVTLTLHPVAHIPNAPHDLLAVHLARYRGRPITLPGGEHIARGTLVAELHLNNHQVSATASSASGWRLLRLLEEDMAALAAWVGDPNAPGSPAKAEAFMGVTLLGRVGGRLGFTIRERPVTIHARLERFFMAGLLAIYNPAGVQRLERGGTFAGYPVEIWMSRAALLRRYGGQPRPSMAGAR